MGLQNAGIVVDHPTVLVQLGELAAPGPLVTALGLLVTVGLVARGRQFALLAGIVAATAAAVAMGVAEAPQTLASWPPSLAPTWLALDVPAALELGLVNLVFAFVFVDLFDTVATSSPSPSGGSS